MLPTASWIAFTSNVMSGCHAFYNASRCYPICHCFCLSFSGFLACSFSIGSIETAYGMVVVCLYINVYNNKNQNTMLCHICQVVLHSTRCFGIFAVLLHNVHGGTGQTRKATSQSRQQQHDILRGLIFSKPAGHHNKYCTIACVSPIFTSILFGSSPALIMYLCIYVSMYLCMYVSMYLCI